MTPPPDTEQAVIERPAELASDPGGDGKPPRESLLKQAMSWGELRHTKYGMRPGVIIALILGFQTFDTFGFGFAGPEILREFDISFQGLNSVVSMLTFFGPIIGIGVAYYLDRRPRLPVFLAGTAISGIASMATAGTNSTLTLGMTRIADNTVEGAVQSAQFSLLSDYYAPKERGRVFALVNLLESFGRLLGRLIIGGLLVWLGVRLTFVFLGAPLVLMAILGVIFLREPVRGFHERKEMGASDEIANTEQEPVSLAESFRVVWATRTLRRQTYGLGLLLMALVPFGFFFQFFLVQEYGLNAAQRGALMIPAGVGAIAGAFLGGGLLDAFSKRSPRMTYAVVAGFLMIFVAAILALSLQPPLWVVVVLFSLSMFGSALGQPALAALGSQVVPPQVRTLGIQVMGLAAITVGPFQALVAFPVYNAYGFPALFALVSGVGAVAVVTLASAGAFFEMDRRNATSSAMATAEWRRTIEEGRAKLLVCRDVTVHYGPVQVLFGVDFDVDEGQIIALLGTNGAGKSTLLRAISGISEASGGAIVFDGRDITHMPPHEIAQRRVIHMPGGRGVFPGLSVKDNLILGAWMVDDAERDARLEETYEIFPRLCERRTTLAGSLSGGEQQQLSLAQAFLSNPRLLCIDELSLGLSPNVVAELIEKVKEIHARGTTIIIVEQSINVALTIADRAIFMEKGEVKFFGDTKELLQRPDILRAVYVKGTGVLTGAPAGRPLTGDAGRPAATALEVAGLSKSYGGVQALDDISFDVTDGTILGVIGPNGSGKTTLFDVISGFQPADAGIVRYQGVDITKQTPEERSRAGLIRRFQDARLFPSLTVHETLLLALDQQLTTKNVMVNAVGIRAAKRNERKLQRQADRLIELLDLGAFRDKFVKELSTGLRRIVDIACTIARNPNLLLLDEPSSGIAQAEAEALAPLLKRIKFETGCTIMIIEHDIPLLSRISDEMMVLETGRLLTRGSPEEVLNDDRVIEAYLGTSEAAVKRSGGVQ